MNSDTQVGTKIYSIEARKVVEYTVTQKVTTETLDGIDTKFYVTNKGAFRPVSTKELFGEYFTDKKEADNVLALVNKYA